MPRQSTIHDIRFETMLKLLKDARLNKGLTQEELSALLGQHRIYITKVEKGQRRLDVLELFDICKALDLSIYDVIRSTLDNNPSEETKSTPEYTLGFSNGYIQGRGYEGDQSISTRMNTETDKEGKDE